MAVNFLSDTEQTGFSLEYHKMWKEIVVKTKRHDGVLELYCIEIGLVEFQSDGGQMGLNINPEMYSVIAPLVWVKSKWEMQGHPIHGFLACY